MHKLASNGHCWRGPANLKGIKYLDLRFNANIVVKYSCPTSKTNSALIWTPEDRVENRTRT